jgi:hypothetical protein
MKTDVRYAPGPPLALVPTNVRYAADMDSSVELHVLHVAGLVRYAEAKDATLVLDLDEACFRAQLIAGHADAAGRVGLEPIARVSRSSSSRQGRPLVGYGSRLLRIANQLEALGFEPL